IRRVTAEDAYERMPPEVSGKALSAEEVELLRNWISQGGEYAGHWAYEPRMRKSLPEVEKREWPRGPVDQWLLAGWQSWELSPSPEADRITLLRRLHFDLTGLPPSRQEVADFERDDSPDAFERVV